MTHQKMTREQIIARSQTCLDEDSISEIKYQLYKILAENPSDREVRQLLRQIAPKTPAQFRHNKQAWMEAFRQEYRVIYEKVISLAALGWRYALGLEYEFINPLLQAIPPTHREERDSAITLSKAPYTASEYLEKILNTSDITTRWHYVNELVYAQNDQLLADDFTNTGDPDLADAIKRNLGGAHLNILILGAGCVGLALANALKNSLGEAVNILMIENRV